MSVYVEIYTKSGLEVGAFMSRETFITKVKQLGGDAVFHGNTYDHALSGGSRIDSTDGKGISVICQNKRTQHNKYPQNWGNL